MQKAAMKETIANSQLELEKVRINASREKHEEVVFLHRKPIFICARRLDSDGNRCKGY